MYRSSKHTIMCSCETLAIIEHIRQNTPSDIEREVWANKFWIIILSGIKKYMEYAQKNIDDRIELNDENYYFFNELIPIITNSYTYSGDTNNGKQIRGIQYKILDLVSKLKSTSNDDIRRFKSDYAEDPIYIEFANLAIGDFLYDMEVDDISGDIIIPLHVYPY